LSVTSIAGQRGTNRILVMYKWRMRLALLISLRFCARNAIYLVVRALLLTAAILQFLAECSIFLSQCAMDNINKLGEAL
jgi:hypothetical protein